MEGEQTTPLAELPNNSENDSDLVNKILDQLDETAPAEESPPTFEDVQTQKPPVIHATQPLTPAPFTPSVPYNPLVNDSMPSPQGIQSMITTMDMPKIYSSLKMAIFIAVMFMLFVTFGENFGKAFSRLPFSTTDALGGLTGTGKFLQAICFGILYFLSSLFLFNRN